MNATVLLAVGIPISSFLGVAFWHYRHHHERLHLGPIIEYVLLAFLGGCVLLLVH